MTADSNLSPYAPDVIPPYKGRPDRNCPVCGEPEDKPHTPDCEYAVLDYLHMPGMENSRLNAMDWRFNGIEERLGTVESNASAFRLTALEERLLALEERLLALEDWADIELEPVDDRQPDSIHALIADGMTGVTADCEARIAATVAPLLARLSTLESKAPC